MEVYLIQSSLVIAFMYGIYRYIVQHESNHQINRLLGMGMLIFACTIALIPMNALVNQTVYPGSMHTIIQKSSELQQQITPDHHSASYNTILWTYWIGVLVFLSRTCIGLLQLSRMYMRSKRFNKWGFKVTVVNQPISPFSLFNVLFLNKELLTDEAIDMLISHEKAHKDQLHSIDTCLLEILKILFWFNPFIWFFQRAIKAEHEYQADATVIKQGVAPYDYQLLLFKNRTGISFQFGNYFSIKTSLNKRFTMMNKVNNQSKLSAKSILIPIFSMLTVMALSAYSGITSKQYDKPAAYENGAEAMYKILGDNLNYPLAARKANSQGQVLVSFTVDENGKVTQIEVSDEKGHLLEEIVVVGYSDKKVSSTKTTKPNKEIEAEVIRTVGLLGKFNPAEKDGKPVSSVLTIPITFKIASE